MGGRSLFYWLVEERYAVPWGNETAKRKLLQRTFPKHRNFIKEGQGKMIYFNGSSYEGGFD
jgi:hypothetical protein